MYHVGTGYPSIDQEHLKGVSMFKQNPTILPLNLFDLFKLFNKKRMHEIAIEDGNKKFTKEELKNDSITIANGLNEMGLSGAKNSSIGIAMSNRFEAIVVTFAANMIGIKVFNIDETNLKKELNRIKLDCIFIEDGKLPELIELKEYLDDKFLTVVCTCDDNSALEEEWEEERQVIGYESLKSIGAVKSKRKLRALCIKNKFNKKNLLFPQTSGSTAEMPKILQFKNKNFSAFLSFVQASTGAKPNEESIERVLIIIPIRISYGWTLTFANVCIGNCVRFAKDATPESIGKYYEYKPTYIYGTPVIFQCFMEKTPENADLSFLKRFYIAGFSAPDRLIENGTEYLKRHGSDGQICNNYGIGEALCIGTTSDGIQHKPGYSGKFYLGADWLIVNENYEEVKYGETGEIIVASETLSDGYHADPEATKNAFIQKNKRMYFRTGDYGCIEKDGYVKILGRKKRFYQPIGAKDKVNCETIEKALLSHKNVKECAVIIFSKDNKYEESMAFVSLKKNRSHADMKKKLYKYLRTILHEFQMPARIVFIKELPRLDSSKVDYKKLEEICSSKINKPL